MKRTSLKSVLMLLACTMLWGSSFVNQSVSMDYIGPFTFNAARSFLAGAALLPVIPLLDRREGKKGQPILPKDPASRRALLKAGLWCGIAIALGGALQQVGMVTAEASKAGFLTSLYVVIVPLLGVLLFHQKLPRVIWLAVGLALGGMYLLAVTGEGGGTVSFGDLMLILCSLGFAAHILMIDRFTRYMDPVRLSCLQFFVAGGISLVLTLLTERPDPAALLGAWKNLLYAGLFCSAAGYTMQMIAQKDCDPTVVSLLLSLESVFGALFGALILHERLSGKELAGCALILTAVILAQLPERNPAGTGV